MILSYCVPISETSSDMDDRAPESIMLYNPASQSTRKY